MSSTVFQPYRLSAAAAGTPFLDGYSTGSAAFLILMSPGLTAWEMGAFASLYLLTFSVGAIVFGWLADHFGRRRLFAGSMLCFALVTLFCAAFLSLKNGPDAALGYAPILALLALRGVTGLLLGGDYPVGQALVAELIPAKDRARHLSLLMFGWYAGALFAVLISWPLRAFDLPWLSFLWIQALLAFFFWFGRRSVPESAAWSEARCAANSSNRKAAHGIFAEEGTLTAFLFCTVFWLCQTIPATVLMFYSTKILSGFLDTESTFIQVLLLYGCFFIGVLPSTHPALAKRPKAVLIGTFFLMAFALGIIALGQDIHSSVLMGSAFILFALAYGLQTPLDFVFPNMLFPAGSRARLVGLTTTISRIGSMGAAFAFPLLSESFSVESLFWAGCAFLLFGATFSWKNAPQDAY